MGLPIKSEAHFLWASFALYIKHTRDGLIHSGNKVNGRSCPRLRFVNSPLYKMPSERWHFFNWLLSLVALFIDECNLSDISYIYHFLFLSCFAPASREIGRAHV